MCKNLQCKSFLPFGKVNGYFEKIDGNKYVMLVPINETKEKNVKIEETLELNHRFTQIYK